MFCVAFFAACGCDRIVFEGDPVDAAADADTDTDSDSDADADAGTDDECCSEIGQEHECWMQDAADDGIICPTNDAAPSDSPACLNAAGCDFAERVCQCASDDDCNDGGTRVGVCVIDAGAALGQCAPSWCNGYKVCSCWGGCISADVSPPCDADETCSEGDYATCTESACGSGSCS